LVALQWIAAEKPTRQKHIRPALNLMEWKAARGLQTLQGQWERTCKEEGVMCIPGRMLLGLKQGVKVPEAVAWQPTA
jgi:hypothetical protein